MRGVIFLMFESFVVERRGFDAYEALLEGVAGRLASGDSFIGPNTYRAEDLVALVDAEAAAAGLAREPLLRDLGRFAFPRLAMRFAWLCAGHRRLPAFLSYLHRIARETAGFELEQTPAALRIAYRSPRHLCALAEGLLEGAATHFNTTLPLAKLACVDRGDPRCVWQGHEA
jgi:hypothetical protein